MISKQKDSYKRIIALVDVLSFLKSAREPTQSNKTHTRAIILY